MLATNVLRQSLRTREKLWCSTNTTKKNKYRNTLIFFCKQRVYKQLFHYYGKFIQLLWLLSLWFPELLVSVHFQILLLNPHVSNITINSKQELPDLPSPNDIQEISRFSLKSFG